MKVFFFSVDLKWILTSPFQHWCRFDWNELNLMLKILYSDYNVDWINVYVQIMYMKWFLNGNQGYILILSCLETVFNSFESNISTV